MITIRNVGPMTHPRTFAIADGCPFRGDATFPGCAHWPRCLAGAVQSLYPSVRCLLFYEQFVPALEVAAGLASCSSFDEKKTQKGE